MPKQSYLVSKAKKSLARAQQILRKRQILNNLPPEILFEILKHLPLKQQQILRRTSKKFEETIPTIYISEDDMEDLQGEWLEAIYQSFIFLYASLYEDLLKNGKKIKIYHLNPAKNVLSKLSMNRNTHPQIIEIENGSGKFQENISGKSMIHELSRLWKQEIFRLSLQNLNQVYLFLSTPNFAVSAGSLEDVVVQDLNHVNDLVQNFKVIFLQKMMDPTSPWPLSSQLSDDTKNDLVELMNDNLNKIKNEFLPYVSAKSLTQEEKMEYLIELFDRMI